MLWDLDHNVSFALVKLSFSERVGPHLVYSNKCKRCWSDYRSWTFGGGVGVLISSAGNKPKPAEQGLAHLPLSEGTRHVVTGLLHQCLSRFPVPRNAFWERRQSHLAFSHFSPIHLWTTSWASDFIYSATNLMYMEMKTFTESQKANAWEAQQPVGGLVSFPRGVLVERLRFPSEGRTDLGLPWCGCEGLRPQGRCSGCRPTPGLWYVQWERPGPGVPSPCSMGGGLLLQTSRQHSPSRPPRAVWGCPDTAVGKGVGNGHPALPARGRGHKAPIPQPWSSPTVALRISGVFQVCIWKWLLLPHTPLQSASHTPEYALWVCEGDKHKHMHNNHWI